MQAALHGRSRGRRPAGPPAAHGVNACRQRIARETGRCYAHPMRRVRPFVIGLLMLWLPLQAIAAVSMPFCPHGGTAGVAQTSVHSHHQHQDSTAASGHHGGQPGDQHPTAGALEHCNNCGACNLACAPAVPVSPVLLSGVAITVQLHFSADSRGLFVPDQPQPPPNSRF